MSKVSSVIDIPQGMRLAFTFHTPYSTDRVCDYNDEKPP